MAQRAAGNVLRHHSQQIIDILRDRTDLLRWPAIIGISGADQNRVALADQEDDAASSVGQYQGMMQGQATGLENQVNAFSQPDSRIGGGIIHPADMINKGAGRVDKDAGSNRVPLAAEHIADVRGAQPAALLVETRERDVVGGHGAVNNGVQHVFQRQAGIVAVTIIIERPAA